MLPITLTRFHSTPLETLGVLKLSNHILAYTLELPWKQNKRNISCIPFGTYEIIRHSSPRHGFSFWLQNVPKRSEILIHAGNFTKDIRGCILVGESINYCRTYSSQNAMRLLEQTIKTTTNLIIQP